jgi:hypothetical protein
MEAGGSKVGKSGIIKMWEEMGLHSDLELYYWALKQEGNLSHSPVSADKIFCPGEVTTVQPKTTIFSELFETMWIW